MKLEWLYVFAIFDITLSIGYIAPEVNSCKSGSKSKHYPQFQSEKYFNLENNYGKLGKKKMLKRISGQKISTV